jgi:hypothetical protein
MLVCTLAGLGVGGGVCAAVAASAAALLPRTCGSNNARCAVRVSAVAEGITKQLLACKEADHAPNTFQGCCAQLY